MLKAYRILEKMWTKNCEWNSKRVTQKTSCWACEGSGPFASIAALAHALHAWHLGVSWMKKRTTCSPSSWHESRWCMSISDQKKRTMICYVLGHSYLKCLGHGADVHDRRKSRATDRKLSAWSSTTEERNGTEGACCASDGGCERCERARHSNYSGHFSRSRRDGRREATGKQKSGSESKNFLGTGFPRFLCNMEQQRGTPETQFPCSSLQCCWTWSKRPNSGKICPRPKLGATFFPLQWRKET